VKLSAANFPSFVRFTRGLRFRLTLSYVLFFTVLLSFIGVFFRQTLRSIYYDQTKDLLSEEWGAVKGYLRIDKGKVDWYYDSEDPEEAFIVDRLRSAYLLTDATGKVMEISPKYQELGPESPDTIQKILNSQKPSWSERRTKQGVRYLIRSGLFIDDNHRWFYVALCRSLADGDKLVESFTWNYFLFLPVMILSCSLLGWVISGRAISPVNDVAQTAQRITGANLTAQIPSRGADDELDRLIDSFNRMIERLNASFTQTRQFSTDVSHELRTPLTAIRGQLEVALFTAHTPEQYREAIVDALQDVERLSQTIRALLLLSQAESGQLNLQRQTLDFAALVADIVDQFQIPAEGAKVELTCTLPPECPMEGDKIQLERLVSNLLSNAVKYTPENGKVHVAVEPYAEHVELIVEDTGMGIPADHLPHIFDRFYRVPSADRNPERGLGLGLSFVAWIVKAHGGRIDVHSKAGEGTRFTVTIPRGTIRPNASDIASGDSTAIPEGAEKAERA
jgi:heavy metal sensor kinase